ncbi:MAG: hypothetical protein E7485_08735 [Ruminococcaceae bacterium]|nr:hypothetical protein [Oscillospiraceae bacterium]
MQDNFICCYASISNIRHKIELNPGHEECLSYNALINLLLLAMSSSWCSDVYNIDDMQKITITDAVIAKITTQTNTTPRTFKKTIKELQEAHLLYKVKKDVFYVNPFFVAHGSSVHIKQFRAWCVANNIFVPFELQGFNLAAPDAAPELQDILSVALNTDPDKQRHICLYLTPENISRFGCFAGVGGIKKLNASELIYFLAMSTSANFIKAAKTPELCNVYTQNITEQDRLARLWGVDSRTIRYIIANLTAAHLLHKCKGTNGKYIINPFLAAKGQPAKIAVLQQTIINNSDYFGGCAAGDVIAQDGVIINKETGEVLERSHEQ